MMDAFQVSPSITTEICSSQVGLVFDVNTQVEALKLFFASKHGMMDNSMFRKVILRGVLGILRHEIEIPRNSHQYCTVQ